MTLFKSSTSIIIVLLALCSLNSVFAHTYLSSVYLNNNLLEEGDCVRPHPRTEWDFPIPLVSQADMTCGWLPAAAQPANRKCPIAAGSTIGIQWHHNSNSPSDDIVDPTHKGPVIVYLAKSDTGAGNVWFKIFEDGYVNGRWGVDRMLDRRGRVDITIPADIEPGNYLLRGEILALHGAYALNGVQPYVGCVELTISGNGNAKPAGVAIPGAYKQTDPGMLVSIYYGLTGYIIPGPAVYRSGSSTGSNTGSSNTVAPTAAPTTRPATQAPVTQAPVTQAPVTQAPVTQAPVTQAPVTQAPTTKPTSAATQAPSTGSLSGFCTSKSNGDYCSPTDAGSYVSCPWEQNRPCAAGLVCQARATGGAIDCVAPRAGQNTQAPATQAPATQAPATQAPATQAPATQAPATQAPATQAPATQAPVTQAPVTQPPVTQAPATQAPTSAPATQAPGSLNGFCASKARGDYCSPTEEGSYVSCPFETNRPCAAGQVCQARAGTDGVVDCVAPSSSGGPTTRPGTSPTTRPGTSAPTTPPKPIPSTMRKIIYIISNYVNGNVGDTIKAAVDSGYTHVILAFWVNHGECGRKCAAYAAADWAAYDNKQAVLDYVHSKNAYLLISGGGAVDDWFSEMIPGDNTGVEIGTALANWAMANGPLDGVDLDLEGGITWPGAVQAAVDATNTVRRIIGPNRIIAHAPQAPFFHSNYLSVYDSILRLAGDTIDFIMIQFYNQDLGCYDLYDQVFLSSIITSPVTKWQCFAGTSVNEIHLRTNYPLNKIVVGKYISDGSSNWVAPEALHDWVSQAYNQLGWEGGIMLWDWRAQAPNYRTTIFG